jgi:hypothetical protein
MAAYGPDAAELTPVQFMLERLTGIQFGPEPPAPPCGMPAISPAHRLPCARNTGLAAGFRFRCAQVPAGCTCILGAAGANLETGDLLGRPDG